MIQVVIGRLAENSFRIKGMTVTLVSALAALAASRESIAFVMIAWFPAFAFWLLDSYYLHQERRYRRLFDEVRRAERRMGFSMDASEVSVPTPPFLSSMLSPTALGFHGVVLVTVGIVTFAVGGGEAQGA